MARTTTGFCGSSTSKTTQFPAQRVYGGLGIGLAICRRLVELLGGRLTHHSQPGQGSQFQLLLELEPSAQILPHTPRSPLLVRAPGDCVVLLVEDPQNPVVVRAMLLKLGYRVLGVDSGQAAIDALRRERVDAVLLNARGYNIARRTVAKYREQLNIPVARLRKEL